MIWAVIQDKKILSLSVVSAEDALKQSPVKENVSIMTAETLEHLIAQFHGEEYPREQFEKDLEKSFEEIQKQLEELGLSQEDIKKYVGRCREMATETYNYVANQGKDLIQQTGRWFKDFGNYLEGSGNKK